VIGRSRGTRPDRLRQTGTGKTAAFAIPTIELLVGATRGSRSSAARDARARARADARARSADRGDVRHARPRPGRQDGVLIGANDGAAARRAPRRPTSLLRPPPALRSLERRTLSLGTLRIVVLDEADRMLDMGFAPQVERILRVTPLDGKTLCFSATMPTEVETLVRRISSAVRVDAGVIAKPSRKSRRCSTRQRPRRRRRSCSGSSARSVSDARLHAHQASAPIACARAVGAAGHR